ncbi:MAG: hypothetical protein WC884_04045 [Candidatus Paceibacterota bacterium]
MIAPSWAVLFWMGISGIAWVPITISIIKNPEKVQKWASMISGVFGKVWKEASYFAIKNNIEGNINEFVGELNDNTSTVFPKISIKWTAKNNEEIVWEEGGIILVMRDREHSGKNIAHAAYFFVSELMLKKAKLHLSKTQKTCIDLYATQKIMQKQGNSYSEQFMSSYFVPEIQKDVHGKIGEYIKKFTNLDRSGLFFPVFIQELNHLGNKVFLEKLNQDIILEADSLIDFLEAFSDREVGDMTVPDCFHGKYLRCSIRIVASTKSRINDKVDSHKKRIGDVISGGFEDIYIIGSNEKANSIFIEKVIKSVLADNPNVKLVKRYAYESEIKIKGKRIRVDTSLSHLVNSEAIKYIYTAEEMSEIRSEIFYENC